LYLRAALARRYGFAFGSPPGEHRREERENMSDAGTQFSDGKAYERLMGRWSRVVGEKFLDWLALSKGLRWLDSAAAMAPSPKS
jgi:hypothetical protein